MLEQAAQALDDRKPETQSAAALRLRGRELNELAKYVPLLFLQDAGAGVANIDAQLCTAAAAADRHAPAPRIAYGVGH